MRKSQSVGKGQTIVTDYPKDTSSNGSNPGNMTGKSMGGSTTNLAHSLSGCSAKQDGNATKQKPNRVD